MKVAVTGATGFTGRHLVKELASRGHDIRALVRPSSDVSPIREVISASIACDLSDTESVARALEGADCVISVMSLGTGLADPLLESMHLAGISRGVFTSTTGIFTTLNPASKQIRLNAESSIEASGLTWTILRPTMIYGTPGDRNMWRLISWIRRMPFVPVVGSGEHTQQPVHVEDLAWVLAEAAESGASAGKSYNISGGSVLTFREVVDTIAHHLGKRVLKLHLPLGPMHAAVRGAERTGLRLPVKSEQLLRLNEDKSFSHAPAAEDLGYAPRSFDEGIRSEVRFLTERR